MGNNKKESKIPCPHPLCEGMNVVGGKFCVECGKPIQEDTKLKVEGGDKSAENSQDDA